MLDLLVTVHSVFRWVVLLTALPAIAVALMSAGGTRRWGVVGDRSSLFFTLAMDVQFLIGLLVWVLGQRWQGDVGLGWLHPLAMLVAVALAHVGRARADLGRNATSTDKGRQAAIFFGASLLVILIAIPLNSWPL
ncbi:MAG TPA: hypothetical protein VND68_13785 [Chloroflexia bacterium]|jgi:hypothetical protein|nr:hypothetical protein [Chloroflexia bacterium]